MPAEPRPDTWARAGARVVWYGPSVTPAGAVSRASGRPETEARVDGRYVRLGAWESPLRPCAAHPAYDGDVRCGFSRRDTPFAPGLDRCPPDCLGCGGRGFHACGACGGTGALPA